MPTELPKRLNLADYFLHARVREGRGDRTALVTDAGALRYVEVAERANRFAHLLEARGLQPEQRVMIALPDGPEFVAVLFGAVQMGAVVVMVNPALPAAEIAALLEYTRARVLVTHRDTADAFQAAARGARQPEAVVVTGTEAFERERAGTPATLELFPSHPDDAAIWLFSGGTTGVPKAVVQTHRSFVNTTECYARHVIGYREDDVTLSVPKLYFGYATGSNLLFPFAAGATVALFPESCTVEALFQRIRQFRPTVLVNVPTMIHKMVSHHDAARVGLAPLRVCTSAGEALPAELHTRWRSVFGVPLLDGLGTAEMWHIFISNRIGNERPGTLGTVVPGFEVRVCDETGRPLPSGETGWLWVRGGSRALGYWQHAEKSAQAFRGEWYVSGDLISMDADGVVTYCGRGDELLKVGGKWLAPQEVEGCLLEHEAVAEAAVVGVTDASGLVKPRAYVVARTQRPGLDEELKTFVRERLQPYKHPREVIFVDALPRTHLGKVDRGKLRRLEPSSTTES
jgi:benzoate-CoA ligase family protein